MSSDLHDLAAPYSLDALDSTERSTFELHLEQCASCREDVGGFLETAARLGDIEPVAPPVDLRSRVLAGARQSAQDRPLLPVGRPARLRRGLGRLAAAAALVVAVGSGALAWTEHQRADDAVTAQDRMTAVLTAADAKSSSSASKDGGHLRVVASRSHDAAVVLGAALPSLDRNRVYQLWTMTDGTPRSAGIIGDSAGMTYVDELGDADAFAITVEPRGGSKRPTTDPIAVTAMTG